MPEPLPELDANEFLLAAIIGLRKPRYVRERWAILEPGETWDDQEPQDRPDHFLAVESFLFALAGHLRYLGSISRATAGALGRLLGLPFADAAKIANGEYLERLVSVPQGAEDWTFPSELMLLNRASATDNRALITTALRTYRDSDAASLTELARGLAHDEPGDGLDRNVFSDLAQLAAVYDALLTDDVEILYATIW